MLRAASAASVRLHVIVPGLLEGAEAAHQTAVVMEQLEAIPRHLSWRAHASLSPYTFVSRPMPPALVDRLRAAHSSDPYDAVVSISFRVAHLGECIAAALDLPLLIRPYNLESEYFHELARGASFPKSLPYLAEAWKLRRAESAVHASKHVSLYADIASGDATRRARLTTTPVMHVPPFMTHGAISRVDDAQAGTGTVLFIGSLDNPNNNAGIRWFVDRCWAGLYAANPAAKLQIVGRRASEATLAELAVDGAHVTVDAPEVAPHLAQANVFINPVRRGAGVNIKMVEAMGASLPIVTTTAGARGMHWRDGEHLIVADDAASFRAAVELLLREPDLRARLGSAAKRFVEEELDGVRQIKRLRAILSGRPAPA
jgi:glycosyltransferase involved in cell wall biosynthesis